MSNRVGVIDSPYRLCSSIISENPVAVSSMDISFSLVVPRNFYVEYNFFIDAYNNGCNRIGDLYLSRISTSRSARGCGFLNILLIILALAPFASIPIFLFAIYRLVLLIKIILRVKKNRKRVEDPLIRMNYCKTLNRTNTYVKVTPTKVDYQQLEMIGITKEDYQLASKNITKENIQQGCLVLMFYRDEFKNYEAKVLKYMCPKIYFTVLIIMICLVGIVNTSILLNSMVN